LYKIIYTYKKYKEEPMHITDYGIDMMMTSVCASNRFYETELYCCKDSYDFFIKNEIPFTRITILDELSEIRKGENELWSWSKIVTMKYQNEPWIHLDFDSVITRPFDEEDVDFSFGFPDFYVDSNNKSITPFSIRHLEDIYLFWFDKLHSTPQSKTTWDFNQIPNASFMICNSPQKIKEVIHKFEKDNRWIIDKENWDDYSTDKIGELCCYFEQFLLTKYIKDSLLKTKILKVDGYCNASDDVKDVLENDYTFIQNYIDNGYFHFPLYKILKGDVLSNIFSLFWKTFKIKKEKKYKTPL